MNFGGAAFGDFAKDVLFRISDNEMMEEDRNQRQEFNAAQAERARQWDKSMYDSRYQRQMSDMEKAGLNPMLAFSSAPPGTGGSAVAQSPGGGPAFGHVTSVSSAAQAALISANADKLTAEAENIRADTVVKQGQPDVQKAQAAQMRQAVLESIERAKLYVAQVGTEHATAQQRIEQANLLREQIPQVKSSIELMRAQTQERLQAAGLSESQAKEVMQRISQNLPEIEKAVLELEQKLKSHHEVGARVQAQVDDSFVATVGRYLKALLPIGGVMGAIPIGRGGGAAGKGGYYPTPRDRSPSGGSGGELFPKPRSIYGR